MCIGYKKTILNGEISFKEFFLKRIAKLLPLHVLCFLCALYLYGGISPANMLQWLANLFLVQSWIPVESYYFSGNAVGWCLSDFMFFYLLFPFLIKCMNGRRTMFLSVFCALVSILIGLSAVIPQDYRVALVYINPAVRLLDFIFGMVLYEFVYGSQRINHLVRIAGTRMCWIELSAISLLFISIVGYNWVQSNELSLSLSLYWWPVLAMLIIVFSVSSEGIVTRLLSARSLVYLGKVSFCFYMIHVLGMESLDIFFDKLGLSMPVIINFIAILLLDLVIAMFLYRYYEKPMRNIIQ